MSTLQLFLLVGRMWLMSLISAQQTTTTFPNRFTGRQIIVTVGSEPDRPEYRLLDTGLMYFRRGGEGPYWQLGQYPKEKTQHLFATLEQDGRVKTVKSESFTQPRYTLIWKRIKTEYAIAWDDTQKVSDFYPTFVDAFLKIFPATKP